MYGIDYLECGEDEEDLELNVLVLHLVAGRWIEVNAGLPRHGILKGFRESLKETSSGACEKEVLHQFYIKIFRNLLGDYEVKARILRRAAGTRELLFSFFLFQKISFKGFLVRRSCLGSLV